MNPFIPMGALLLALALCGACDDGPVAPLETGERVSGPETVESLRQDDIQAKSGRAFVYLDAHGSIHRTVDYNSIPLDRRGAVIVVDGKKRRRVRREADGRIQIEALPPLIRAQVDAGGGSNSVGVPKGAADPNLEEFRKLFNNEIERSKNPDP